MYSITTSPSPGVTSAPAPTTFFPAGQVTVAPLFAELVADVCPTCSTSTTAAEALWADAQTAAVSRNGNNRCRRTR